MLPASRISSEVNASSVALKLSLGSVVHQDIRVMGVCAGGGLHRSLWSTMSSPPGLSSSWSSDLCLSIQATKGQFIWYYFPFTCYCSGSGLVEFPHTCTLQIQGSFTGEGPSCWLSLCSERISPLLFVVQRCFASRLFFSSLLSLSSGLQQMLVGWGGGFFLIILLVEMKWKERNFSASAELHGVFIG